MKLLMALLCGILFGFGLALSGMTDIANVIGFLDLFGDWNPALAFVMVGGLLVSLPFFQFGLGKIKAQTPLLFEQSQQGDRENFIPRP